MKEVDDEALALIDAAMANLQRLRDRVAEPEPDAESADANEDDFIDTWTAATRFNLPVDTIRWLCREKGMGRKDGGRWLVSVKALRHYLDSRSP
ncbi:helix-turn-helix domain-containing protein [Rhizobium ruizarguesonis]|uniref:helix-turn-helix domain-containing protein n=1 Tax=Rhizobium leguminosarum TaxID=384 RepID=UPI00103035EE|nr:helix-turn-helix domain-containing protein [Rhizobium leguminosarum]TAV10671.1 DNA-binding protein [Rhizobium leguminosarum]